MRKKKYVIVSAIIFIFALIPVGVFADENKALDVQLTKLELQNDKEETITETSVGSSFKLFANYTINDTVHTGDYFDMAVPEQIDLSSAFTDYNFHLNDSEGEAIATAVVKPSESGGGIIHIVFNEKMNGKANLQGNLFFYAKGNEKAVKLGEATPIRVVLNNNNKNSYNISPPVKFTSNKPVSGTEVIGKWANPSKSKDRADWRIRINKSGQNLNNVVITDKIKSGNGEYLPEFVLQKVTFAPDGNITNYGEKIDVSNKVKYNDDKTSFTLELGEIGTQGYLLSYATTVNDEDPIQNNSAELRADAIAPGKTAGVWLYKAAGGGLNTEINGKLRIRKVDSETGKGLAGAKFKVTKGDKSFELTSNDKGIALSDELELGEYNITEITAPDGYKSTNEVFTVNVTSNGGILTIKNTKEKKEEPKKPEEPSKPEPKKPDVPNVEQPKKPEEPKKSETPKVEEPKKDTPEIKKPELSKPVEHSTHVLTNTDKNSTQKEQTQTVKKDVPNTGDNNDIVFYSMLLMFTTAIIVRFKKKNN
jgi:LPXTG-motif cell wall-anchored protein